MRKLQSAHGGNDPGAVYKGRREKDDNFALAMEVGRILSENGVDVLYTRTTDDYISPFERARLANEAKVDFFISFHRNSSPEVNQYNGVEVLVYDKNGIKYEMAQNIVGALGELGFREIGVQARPGLVVLRKTKMPALLIETGFLNSDKDNQLYDEKNAEIAQAIAGAILGTLDQQQGEEPQTAEVAAEQSGDRCQTGQRDKEEDQGGDQQLTGCQGDHQAYDACQNNFHHVLSFPSRGDVVSFRLYIPQ